MAVRYWEICSELARHFDVALVAPVVEREANYGFELLSLHRTRAVRELVDCSDVVIASLDVLPNVAWLLTHPAILCIDVMWPRVLEELERRDVVDCLIGRAEECAELRAELDWTTRALKRGDLFICGNDRQRDFWLGWLGAAGRLNHAGRAADSDFSNLVQVVSTGIPRQPPPQRNLHGRNAWPGIGPDDFLILWGGGVWDWTDPFTPLRAMQRLAVRDTAIKLLFVGLTAPTPGATMTATGSQLVQESERLGLAGRTVFIHKGWTPREQFNELLRAADLGISFHKHTLESRFSIRTRFFDYLWAGLPLLASEGDALADYAERQGLGIVLPTGDDERFADTVLEVRRDPARLMAMRRRMEEVALQWTYEHVCQPLVEFCRDPRRRPDAEFVRAMARPYTSMLGAWQRRLRLLRNHGLRAALADSTILRSLKRRLFG